MDLSRVNSDVLISIINSVPPGDLANFVCTCRRVHEHASFRLIQHKDLLQRYGTIDLDGDLGEVMTPILDLLQSIQLNPLAVQYVFNIRFLPDDIESQTDVAGLLEKIEASKIEDLLDQCLWLRSEDRAEWMTAIRSANRGAAFAVLLNFLPNLRRLHLRALELYRSRLSRMLTGQDIIPGTPLNNVRMLHVEHREEEEDGTRLEDIGDLVYLSRLRVLSGFMIKAYDEYENFQALIPKRTNRTSRLRTLRLLQSAISPEQLFEFLRPMEHLERLLYEHGGMRVGGPEEKDIDEYAEEFEAVAQGWLEERTLGLEVEGTNTIVLSKEAFGRWKRWRSRPQR